MERIILSNKDHEHEAPSYDDVSIWVNKLMAIKFLGRDILVKQMQGSKYKLINGFGFISIKFCVNSEKEKFPFRIRIPIEMTTFQQDKHPIVFLLHVVDGIIDEVEIYSTDGSLIDNEIFLENVTYCVNEVLKV